VEEVVDPDHGEGNHHPREATDPGNSVEEMAATQEAAAEVVNGHVLFASKRKEQPVNGGLESRLVKARCDLLREKAQQKSNGTQHEGQM
jgi:hypothetical protein